MNRTATLMTQRKAMDLAVKLNAEAEDGRRYRAGWLSLETKAAHRRSWGVEVRDEEGTFLGYL